MQEGSISYILAPTGLKNDGVHPRRAGFCSLRRIHEEPIMFNKILVALDSGDTCHTVFNQAVALAQATRAKLLLLSVLDLMDDTSLLLPTYPGFGFYPLAADENLRETYAAHYQKLESDGLDRLRGFADEATAAGVEATFTQTGGSPGSAICDQAKTWQADLIMVGSHGRKGLGEIFLGSVSNYVIHHAPCSVMVVHPPSDANTQDETADLAAVVK